MTVTRTAAHRPHVTRTTIPRAAQRRPAAGANPTLARAVRSIDIQRFHARGHTTFCNQAFNAYAKKLGYGGFNGLIANQMYKKMSSPGSGWRRVSADEAMRAAKSGKLVCAAWYNSRNQPGRPDGKAPGHVAAVIGEYAPGVPGIAQAGRKTFEWGPITATRKNPSYFVRE